MATNANEGEVLEIVEAKLGALRRAYRERRSEFSAEVIAFLKGVAALEGTLREFLETLDEKASVRTRDDAVDLSTRFQDFADRLRPHLVAKRAEKEARELVEKSKSLPFAAVVSAEADFRRRVAKLEQNPRVCHRCKNKMTLRESQHGLFWGCSAFPACFGRSWLNKTEMRALNSDR